jgi:hypothetical protein
MTRSRSLSSALATAAGSSVYQSRPLRAEEKIPATNLLRSPWKRAAISSTGPLGLIFYPA